MKNLLLLATLCSTLLFASCDKEQNKNDKDTIYFEDTEITLPAEGGEVIIPVYSTGVDYATIKYTFEDAWNFTPDGNMVPREGWIKLEVIPNYPEARSLLMGRSGIKLTVEANKSIANRTAWLIVGSFNATSSVTLQQPSTTVKQ